jgi:hypothetical protein
LPTATRLGSKIKNFERIKNTLLEEGSVQMAAPDLEVEVQAFLLATYRRNPETSIKVYSLLIGACMRGAAHTEPPKITLPRPRETCQA